MITPEVLANHCNRLALRTIFTGQEAPSEYGRNLKSGEEIGTDALTPNCFRRSQPAQGKVAGSCGKDRNVLKTVLLITPCEKVRYAEGMDAGFATLMQASYDQLLGVGIRQRTQQNSIHQAEDRGVSTDADGDGQNGQTGKGGRFANHSQAVMHVAKQCLHSKLPTHRADLMLN